LQAAETVAGENRVVTHIGVVAPASTAILLGLEQLMGQQLREPLEARLPHTAGWLRQNRHVAPINKRMAAPNKTGSVSGY
jgi:hypothetical protein